MRLLKYTWLKLGKFIRKVCSGFAVKLSYLFLVFSVLVCLIILFPSYFDRVPTLSYFIREHELPITYELCGEVRVLNENGDIINKNIEVFIGGYKTSVLPSAEFNLKFSSPIVSEVFVVIRYEVNGEICEYTKCLIIENGVHIINEEFIIYV